MFFGVSRTALIADSIALICASSDWVRRVSNRVTGACVPVTVCLSVFPGLSVGFGFKIIAESVNAVETFPSLIDFSELFGLAAVVAGVCIFPNSALTPSIFVLISGDFSPGTFGGRFTVSVVFVEGDNFERLFSPTGAAVLAGDPGAVHTRGPIGGPVLDVSVGLFI